MIKWFLRYFKSTHKDLSEHRSFTVTADKFRYEDLCQ